MSDLPVFKHDGPVSTVYQNGVPRLEQNGEQFTFAEYDHKLGKWNGQPEWIPKGRRELAELQSTVDKLIIQLKAVEAALTATKLMFSQHFSAVGVEPVPTPVNPYFVNVAASREKMDPYPIDREVPSLYPNEQKKSPPVKPKRKRSPNKKKIPPAT
jgi:hypothetical protein